MADVNASTLGKYFAGIDDDSASYEIVRKLVMCMGGSLDEMAGIAPPKSVNAPPSVQHPPVGMIREEVSSACQRAIRDVLESCAHRSQHDNLVWWRMVAIAEMLFIISILLWDITHPNMGYIQYPTAMIAGLRALM